MMTMKIKYFGLAMGLLLTLVMTPVSADGLEFYGVIRDYKPVEKTFSVNGISLKLDNNSVFQSNDGVTASSQKMLRDGRVVNGVALSVSSDRDKPAIVKEVWFNN